MPKLYYQFWISCEKTSELNYNHDFSKNFCAVTSFETQASYDKRGSLYAYKSE